jgi:hypothetical protein
MVEIKWTSILEVDPKRDYLAFAEMGERKSMWSFFSFIMRTRKVQGQLKAAKGVIGYTARLEFSSKKLVMVAVFENEKAFTEFAHAGQHAQCMEKTRPDLKGGGLKYAKWSISGADIPLKIDDAINKIQTK